jgi:hypothetical protein
MDHKSWLPRHGLNNAANPVTVAIECKPASPIPQVGHIPEHEVSVELVEAIMGIKQSQAKASLLLIAREAGVLSHPRVDPRVQQSLCANATQQG